MEVERMGSALNWRLHRIKAETIGDGDLPLKEIVTVPVSFETVGIGQTKIRFPYAVTIKKIRAIAMNTIEATSDGYITCGNATGASTAGVVTCTKALTIGAEFTAVVPTTNMTVAADSYYYMTTSKANVGGAVLVILEYIRSA
jgi:hypothetical protein